MLRLSRITRSDYQLAGDKADLSQLLDTLRESMIRPQAQQALLLEPGLVRGTTTAPREHVLQITATETPSALCFGAEGAVLELDEDDLQYCITQVAAALRIGYFYPAELVQVTMPKSRQTHWLYASHS